jgi:hypothetical protein
VVLQGRWALSIQEREVTMSSQTIRVHVPPAVAAPRAADRAADAVVWTVRVLPAALAARVRRWTRAVSRRLRATGEPRNAEDVLILARSIERQMPSLAAELRFFAMNRPEAEAVSRHE